MNIFCFFVLRSLTIRIAANHSDFGGILPLFTQYSAIPIGMPKFRQNLRKSVTLIPWTRTTHAFARLCIREIYFNVLFHHAAGLHLFLAAACNGAYDWLACGYWPMSSLETNVLLLFLLDAGEYNF